MPNATTSNLLLASLEPMGIMLFRFPLRLRLWIVTLMSINLVGVFLWPGRLEPLVILGCFCVGPILMTILYQFYGGFTKLLGLMHCSWLILLPWIAIGRLPMVEEDTAFRAYLVAVVVLDGISLILDIRDVYQYVVLGQTEPTMVWKTEQASEQPVKEQIHHSSV